MDDKWGKKNEGEYLIWLDYKHEVFRRSFWGKCQVSHPFKALHRAEISPVQTHDVTAGTKRKVRSISRARKPPPKIIIRPMPKCCLFVCVNCEDI